MILLCLSGWKKAGMIDATARGNLLKLSEEYHQSTIGYLLRAPDILLYLLLQLTVFMMSNLLKGVSMGKSSNHLLTSIVPILQPFNYNPRTVEWKSRPRV